MLLPYQEILILTIIIIFVATLAHRFMVDPEKIRQIKNDMNFYRKKSREAQKSNDLKKASEYTNEMLKLNQRQLSLAKKPLIISSLVFIVSFYTVLAVYGNTNPLTGEYMGGIKVDTNDVAGQNTNTGILQYRDLKYPFQTHEVYADEKGVNKTMFKITIDYNQNNDFSDDEAHDTGGVVDIGGSAWRVYHSDLNRTFFMVALDLPFTFPILGKQIDWIWWYVICAATLTFIIRKALGVE